MSLRARFYLFFSVGCVIGLAIVSLPVFFGFHAWVGAVLFAWLVVFGGGSLQFRCPQCRKPICGKKYGWIEWSHPWAERVCSQCGLDLRSK